MNKYIKYSICGITVFIAAAAVQLAVRQETAEGFRGICLLLSDTSFLTGVLLTGIGGLMFVSEHGMFDLFYYTLSGKTIRENVTYREFKASGHKGKKDPVPMMITGAGFIFMSVLFCVLYFI